MPSRCANGARAFAHAADAGVAKAWLSMATQGCHRGALVERPRECLAQTFDGVYLSSDWKYALWAKFFMGHEPDHSSSA
jgi:hypothetical protein